MEAMGVLSQALTSGLLRSHSQIAAVSNSRIFGREAVRLPINQSRLLCRAPSAFYQLTFRAPGPQIVLRFRPISSLKFARRILRTGFLVYRSVLHELRYDLS